MKKPACVLLILATVFCLAARPRTAAAQAVPVQPMSAADIKLALKKLNVLGSVLYVAAHPDDENTRMITYMAKGRGMETAYISLTRGDGGQNLIGKEVWELLGLIRTQELLAARRTDGGHQMFSRAYDFGYSKTPVETFDIWDKEKVKADLVWAIRKWKPDVILTRFSPGRTDTHGHHTGSAMLAEEAFAAAADPLRYPEQLAFVAPWQATRLFWNTSWWFFRSNPDFDRSKLLPVDAGGFNALLGQSYGEIAAESRTMHKSQGFGSARQRGMEIEYFELLKGSPAKEDLLEGLDLTWNRVPGAEKLSALLDKAYRGFDMENPAASVPALSEAHAEMNTLPQDNHWIKTKKAQLEEVIVQCAGIFYEVTSRDYSVSPGDSVYLTASIIQRNGTAARFEGVQSGIGEVAVDSLLPINKVKQVSLAGILPANTPYSHPYWLRENIQEGMFQVEDQALIGLPENPWPLPVGFRINIGGTVLDLQAPVLYKWTDPVAGERYRPLEVPPPVTANVDRPVFIFAGGKAKELEVTLKSHQKALKGELRLELPEGWTYSPTSIPLSFTGKGSELTTVFTVTPPKEVSDGLVKTVATVGGKDYAYGLTRIDYPHIPIQTLYPPATAKVVSLDTKTHGERIAYIPGAGDAVPEALREIGYQVDILADDDITPQKLGQYQVVITGVRAYNTNERLKFLQDRLMEFVHKGGNLIVQYNTSGGLATDQLGPYPLKLSRDRVTDENADMKFLDPAHPLLTVPNRLTSQDFDGWVQERGLYFPNEWDKRYEAVFETADPGEKATKGALLVASYGEGTFIYTGISFFRQLPAGVPGAYRLFVNMVSYRANGKARLENGK